METHFVFPLVSGYLDWLHLLALVNNTSAKSKTSRNISANLLLALLNTYPERKLLHHMQILFFSFSEELPHPYHQLVLSSQKSLHPMKAFILSVICM